MSQTFYHVDRYANLSPGDVLDLEWPPRLTDHLKPVITPQHMDRLASLYPAGLSRHGARYALAGLVTQSTHDLDQGWEPLSGVIEIHNEETNQAKKHYQTPVDVLYEFLFELYRIYQYPDERSRFQGYFAFEDPKDAVTFAKQHRPPEADIVAVECDQYDVRDMGLVKLKHFGHIFDHGEIYWSGQQGDDPIWEVVMEPPVTVVNTVNCSG